MKANYIYIAEQHRYDALVQINKRLFDDRLLTGDDRRDLANWMHVILNDFIKEEVPS